MPWRLKTKAYSGQWHYLRHNIHTTLISFAPELARQVELLCTLRFNELTYVWVVYLFKKKVRSLVYFPALTLSQTLWNYTGDDASHCSPFKTLLTAQCGSWKRSMWVPSETYTIGHLFVLHLWPNAAHSSATQWQGEWGVMLRPCTVSLLTAECIQTEWQLLKSCNASANILQNILLQD